MVHSYIRTRDFRAISFDLDDTLYDNRPVLKRAEASLMAFLYREYGKTCRWERTDWIALKTSLLHKYPELIHDTTAARFVMLEQGLLILGYSRADAETGAQRGLDHFLKDRSDFTVSTSIITMLEELGSRYPLIGLTNGNVDAAKIGLDSVFQFVLHPGDGTRKKPYPDMFYTACRRLNIAHQTLLHVGDSYLNDIQGARMAGCQSVWLNPAYDRTRVDKGAGMLPHIEIDDISELSVLLS
ncbi:HAD-superfamily hydrolase, subfamily IA, variant 1 [Shewanella sediminis HAW-EB3]|uniref:HAD-superfamily hydrolase, subfamily IA, variant 1 n=1 Tax=Shewanella sediminis (strain HAW-EB3) TaxID=425104 RepID=A8G0V7_SHESH|nr:HAD-IA family hydrolase [Shewanella sediminis]ABV38730.1 HAD-superfamily hydrolase, subfamily IA, variant 1 [Shewanella sediminis HAW-EB3]